MNPCFQCCSSPNIMLLIQAEKFDFGLIHPQNIFPITLWLIHMVLGEPWTAAMFFLERRVFFPCNSAMLTINIQCSPDGGLVNIDCSHCKRGLQFPRCYPGVRCGLPDYYTPTLGVIFVVQPLLGRVKMVLDVLHLYTICLTADWWSPNSFKMVL